jgi:hypothetical protein
MILGFFFLSSSYVLARTLNTLLNRSSEIEHYSISDLKEKLFATDYNVTYRFHIDTLS